MSSEDQKRFEITFVDTTNDEEETIDFSADTKYIYVLSEAAEIFGFESQASIRLAPGRDAEPLNRFTDGADISTAEKLVAEYGSKFYVVPRDEDDMDEEEEDEEH